MQFINPFNIETISAILEFRENTFPVCYKPKKWYRRKAYYQGLGFLRYNTAEEVLKDFPGFVIDKDHRLREKPHIIIRMRSDNVHIYHYDDINECKAALQTLMDDLRTCNVQAVRVNCKTEEGPVSL